MAGRTHHAAAGRLALVLGALLVAVPIVLVGTCGPGYGRTRRASVAVQFGSRILLWALGIRIARAGAGRSGAALVVANHISWVDVLAIAATAPVVPVAKCEVAQWPVIGPLARRAGTVFVSRRIGRDLPDTVARITATLRRGHRVLLFPEGTTTCGGPPATFRRAGFQAAVDAAAPVQSVSIRYTDRQGRPTVSPVFIGDDTLLASVWRVLGAGPVLVRVRWHTPVAATEDGGHRAGNRARAAHCARSRISRALGAEPPTGDPGPGSTDVMSVSSAAFPARTVPEPVVSLERPDRAA